MAKYINIKVFRPTGEFIKSWDKARFEGFTKEINGGLGSCLIYLGEEFDYSGNDLKLNNEVKIYITDKDTVGEFPKEKLIYSGYISNYCLDVKGGKEIICVNLLGYYTLLAQDIWKNGATTTFDYSGAATDIGTIMRGLLDRYIAETTNPKIHYAKADVALTSTTSEYKFEFLTYREGINKLKELAPANWWWYIDEFGRFYFKTKNTTPTHKFIFGRHFSKIKVERSLEKIKNAVMIYNDTTNLLKLYSDSASVNEYGRRIWKIMDDKTAQDTDIDKIGEAFVSEHKDPDVKIVAEILDNNEDVNMGYDIEDINPGDTCIFEGFDEFLSDIFKYNAVITKVKYEINKAIITIEPLGAGIVKRAEDINRRVDAIERESVPSSYTT